MSGRSGYISVGSFLFLLDISKPATLYDLSTTWYAGCLCEVLGLERFRLQRGSSGKTAKMESTFQVVENPGTQPSDTGPRLAARLQNSDSASGGVRNHLPPTRPVGCRYMPVMILTNVAKCLYGQKWVYRCDSPYSGQLLSQSFPLIALLLIS